MAASLSFSARLKVLVFQWNDVVAMRTRDLQQLPIAKLTFKFLNIPTGRELHVGQEELPEAVVPAGSVLQALLVDSFFVRNNIAKREMLQSQLCLARAPRLLLCR